MSRKPTLTILPLAHHHSLRLLPSDLARTARQAFHRHPRLYHLPITTPEGNYLALFPKRSLIKAPPTTPIEKLPRREIPALPTYATIYDALQQMEMHKTPEIAITDEEGMYSGLVTTDSLVRWWSQLGAVQEPGSVLILESYLRNYSLAEIAQVLESDDIRILSAYLLRHDTDLQKTYIVLKINTVYLARVLELLERKGYTPVTVHGDLLMEKNARDQLAALLRYLNM